jgi:hypothetical protein
MRARVWASVCQPPLHHRTALPSVGRHSVATARGRYGSRLPGSVCSPRAVAVSAVGAGPAAEGMLVGTATAAPYVPVRTHSRSSKPQCPLSLRLRSVPAAAPYVWSVVLHSSYMPQTAAPLQGTPPEAIYTGRRALRS